MESIPHKIHVSPPSSLFTRFAHRFVTNRQCSASSKHTNGLSPDVPIPHFLPKMLKLTMPRYKGEMTRGIAVTHALLYLYRLKTCFHCSSVPSSQPSARCATSNTPSTVSEYPKKDQVKGTTTGATYAENQPPTPIIKVAEQCRLFFAVGMHYASLWLLDCCPSEKVYWSVHQGVPPSPPSNVSLQDALCTRCTSRPRRRDVQTRSSALELPH